MPIKEIKSIILKKLDKEESEDKKIDQNKSFDIVTKSKKTDLLNESIDNNLSKSHNEEESKLIYKNGFNTEKKITKLEENDLNNKENEDINDSNPKKGKHKKISIFYKEKEIINDDEKIGNLISNNGKEELELSVIILSLNDSTFLDENRTKERLIDKITEKCQYHKDNRELFICISCGIAFCTHCSDKHKNHDTIERKNIIKFSNDLKKLNEELNKSLAESNIYEIKENNNSNYNNSIEKLQNRLDNIKKMHKGIINNYKRDLDKSLPYLLEYKEKIEQLIDNSYKLDTIKDDQQFMDYYYWYSNIKQKNMLIKQEIENLDKNRQAFNKLLENFDEIIQSIYTKTENDYKLIKKFYYNYNNIENDNQFRNLNNSSNSKSINSSNIQNTPKLNLFNLLNQNDEQKNNYKNRSKNEISKENISSEISSNNEKEEKIINKTSTNSKTIPTNRRNYLNKFNFTKDINSNMNKKNYSQRFSSKKLQNFEKIEEKSEIDESQEDSSIYYSKSIYNIKPNSQNIYYFDFETRRVNEIAVNFNNLNIESFEEYQSTLNYENNFYISGGYNSPKLFSKYNQDENIFIPLKEIPSGHLCHGMLGFEEYIYIISGTKSKKVEKYDIYNNTWVSLSDLKENWIWPSCLEYKNKYLFVFGGKYYNYAKEDNILIEKLDISDNNNKWEQLKINFNNNIKLPFYFGLIHINDNSFLLTGGKYNSNDNKNMNNCYKIIIDDEKIDIKKDNEYKISKNEIFNGKMFIKFKNYYYGEFSSLSYDTFYLVNTYNKTIKEINL